jgi:MFS family permease
MVNLLRESPRPALVRDHPFAPWFAVGTVCFGAFMGQLDASIVTVAFPALQRQYGTSLAAVQWVSLAYLLALTALLVPAGRWSDRIGRKLMYLYGFVVFTAASAACALAPSLGALIALRLVQATGAAMLQANSVALVVTSVPDRMRRSALGIQAAAQALGLASGPVTGGILVAAAGWRWVFFLNVPVGLIAVVMGWYLLPRTRGSAGELLESDAGRRKDGRQSDDLGGMGLLALTTTVGMLAISGLSGLGWSAWLVIVCAAGAVAAGFALVRHERRTTAPLLDFSAMARLGIGRGLGGALGSYLVLFGPLVLFPQLITTHGGTALAAGLLLTTLPVGFGLGAVAGDRLLPRAWSNRHRCAVGGVVATCGAAALAVPAPHAVSVVLLGLLGVGLGIYTPANNAEIMAAIPAGNAATAGGMVNMTRGIGTALGVAVVTLGLHVARTYFGQAADAGQTLTMVVLAAVALAATWAGIGRGGRPAPGGTTAEPEAGTADSLR